MSWLGVGLGIPQVGLYGSGPANLLDLSQDAFSTEADEYVTGRGPLTLTNTVAIDGRGGWSFDSVLGQDYEISWDISTVQTILAGTFARILETPSFLFGGRLTAEDPEPQASSTPVGSRVFTGTGNTIWVGPATRTNSTGNVLTVNRYFLREV
jgi:hypothetical protein